MSKPIPLHRGGYYHIYNRGVNRADIFIAERNYTYFLQLYAKYIEPVAETYAYCLLRNHFHLLVRIKPAAEVETRRVSENPSGLAGNPSQQFGNLFNAYTKAINKAYDRTGSLFEHPFKRLAVTEEAHLLRLVTYIHRNPQRHGLAADFRCWRYSSYRAMLTTHPTRLRRAVVLGWFDGAANFEAAHQREPDLMGLEDLAGLEP